VFVFDGAPAERKQDEIAKRRETREQAEKKLGQARKNGNTKQARKYKARADSLTPGRRQSSIDVLRALGVPVVHSTGAGEGYGAQLTDDDATPVTAVYTSDYDALLFGATEMVKPVQGSNPPDAERIRLQETLGQTGLSHEQLVDAAILMGTDYNDGVSGIGPKRAVKYLQQGRDAKDIVRKRDTPLTTDDVAVVREIFLQPPDGEQPDTWRVTPTNPGRALDVIKDEWCLPPSEFLLTRTEQIHNYAQQLFDNA